MGGGWMMLYIMNHKNESQSSIAEHLHINAQGRQNNFIDHFRSKKLSSVSSVKLMHYSWSAYFFPPVSLL